MNSPKLHTPPNPASPVKLPPLKFAQTETLALTTASCQKQGIVLTALRKAVLRELIHQAPVKAYQLIATLTKTSGRELSPPLVYRVLELFLKKGIIHKLEKLRAYVICKHPQAAHTRCAIFHCTQCQQTLEICNDTFQKFIKTNENKYLFQVDRSSLELYGTCADCQNH